jgi:hypothetical protein
MRIWIHEDCQNLLRYRMPWFAPLMPRLVSAGSEDVPILRGHDIFQIVESDRYFNARKKQLTM